MAILAPMALLPHQWRHWIVQVFWRGANARKNDDHSGSMGWGKISRWLKLPYIQQDDFKNLWVIPSFLKQPLKNADMGVYLTVDTPIPGMIDHRMEWGSRFWGNPVFARYRQPYSSRYRNFGAIPFDTHTHGKNTAFPPGLYPWLWCLNPIFNG